MSKQSNTDGISLLHWLEASIIILAILFCGLKASAEDLPESPVPTAAVKSLQRPVPALRKGFYANSFNRKLAIADLGVRLGDAITTSVNLHDSCRCMHEEQLPKALASSTWGMVGYSLAVSAGIQAGSAYLWNHHHRKMARTAMILDIALDGEADVHNLVVYARRSVPTPATTHPPTIVFHPTGSSK